MKADDPYKAFGSVIGKALGSLKEGLEMIPILAVSVIDSIKFYITKIHCIAISTFY